MLEKTLESPLDCKEIQPVHSEGQPWDFFGRNDAKAETPVLGPPHSKSCKLSWPLESITMIKASGHYGIPVELFQILKNDAVKVLHSICQQIWKTQQWPQDWKRSVFIPTPKKGKARDVQTTTQLHSSHTVAKSCSKFSKPGFNST